MTVAVTEPRHFKASNGGGPYCLVIGQDMSGKALKRVIVSVLLSSMMIVGTPATSHAETPVKVSGVVHITPHLTPKPAVVKMTTATHLPLEIRALKIAESKIGRPYEWGATGPWSFDCSGLVVYSYGRAGYRYAHRDWFRTAADQQSHAQRISRSQLRVGDLVFFGWPAYHVGIYVGHGNFLNAPHTGDTVEIDPIWYDGTPSSYGRIN